jgi:two-component system, chemotaxis family, sensor kinase CheA
MNFDPELLQDFLTESGELLEQLDQDLVQLEATPQDPDLLNQVFRALHTIKGSASFLALTNLVNIAHAAESALNAARNRVIIVDKPAMDLLLQAVDVIKRQFVDLRAGSPLTQADQSLVDQLAALGEGRTAQPKPSGHAASGSDPQQPNLSTSSAGSIAPGEKPLALPANKMDLLPFLVTDLESSLEQVDQLLASLADEAQRVATGHALSDLAESLGKTVEFFECAPMLRLVACLGKLGHEATEASVASVLAPARDVLDTLRVQAKGLANQKLLERPIDSCCKPLEQLGSLEADTSAPAADPTPAAPTARTEPAAPPPATPAQPSPSAAIPAPDAAQPTSAPAAPASGTQPAPGAGEQTIRVEVSRLEALLNLVGELVIQKNRSAALARELVARNLGDQDYREHVTQTASGLDRITSDLQVAVMKTRMQPLDKLFGKYPRLVRDLARKLNKQINLVIEGGETEVDKSVIEELGDPLIHLIRNSCDHGIETPEARKASGKSDAGTLTLRASNSGGHVELLIIDDGKGLYPEKIAAKAIEKGVVTKQQADQMSDLDKIRLIFAPGFSTAEQISDVSGRGVGMDVVKTNIEKIKGTIDLLSEPGKGCTVAIKIPLTVAIMNAMMVGVGDEVYAVPLASVVEIVKPEEAQMATIRQQPVMRLRDSVLPLQEAADLFRQPEELRHKSQYAVVLQSAEHRVGLLVSRLIGQQEIVIKPLDERLDRGGPVSGATVRDDGGVSLIVDIPRVFKITQDRKNRTVA